VLCVLSCVDLSGLVSLDCHGIGMCASGKISTRYLGALWCGPSGDKRQHFYFLYFYNNSNFPLSDFPKTNKQTNTKSKTNKKQNPPTNQPHKQSTKQDPSRHIFISLNSVVQHWECGPRSSTLLSLTTMGCMSLIWCQELLRLK